MNNWTCPYCGKDHGRVDLGPFTVAMCQEGEDDG